MVKSSSIKCLGSSNKCGKDVDRNLNSWGGIAGKGDMNRRAKIF